MLPFIAAPWTRHGIYVYVHTYKKMGGPQDIEVGANNSNVTMVYGTYNELVFLGLLLTNVHITFRGASHCICYNVHTYMIHLQWEITRLF